MATSSCRMEPGCPPRDADMNQTPALSQPNMRPHKPSLRDRTSQPRDHGSNVAYLAPDESSPIAVHHLAIPETSPRQLGRRHSRQTLAGLPLLLDSFPTT